MQSRNRAGMTTRSESTTRVDYTIQPKAGGGYIGVPSDSGWEVIEGATEEEVQRKIEANLLEKFPGVRFGNSKIGFNFSKQQEQSPTDPNENPIGILDEGSIEPARNPARIVQFVIAVILILGLAYYLPHRHA